MTKGQSEEDIDKAIHDSIAFYARNYDIQTWVVGRGKEKVVLGHRDVQKCRFCKLGSPDTSFRNEAHAIPESMGNNNVFTRYECDACNQKFGNTIENDLAGWLLPLRTFSGIRGKNKYPTIKSRDGKSRIVSNESGIKIDHQSDNRFFVADEQSKTLTFDIPVPRHRPIEVWKALIKIGISLIDERRIAYFEETIKWVADDPAGHHPLRMWPVQSFSVPGPSRSDSISFAMLYRNNDYIKLPYAMLFFMYGAQSFQVIIPSNRKDFPVSSPDFELPLLLLFDEQMVRKYGVPKSIEYDLSGTDLVKDEVVRIQGTYDRVIKLDEVEDEGTNSPNPDP